MEHRGKKAARGEKPPERHLSSGLDSLLDAVFDNPTDPFSLYWDVAALLRDDERILVQKKIRRVLRKRGAIGPESALLSACILSLSGFPAYRVLHFLSIYFTGGLTQSLFDLAAGTIFLGAPPLDPSLMYDMTQYTYLEKRLLARRSIEISDRLKKDLSPELLLYLYLLSLRADLSNENIQLVALIMKNCFPAQEVRTRLGVASLEEYGEIARAWKEAEERTIAAEQPSATGAVKGGKASFSLDKASFFLDKYFSDTALEQMQAKAPPLAVPKRPSPIERPRAADIAARERESDVSLDMTAAKGAAFDRPMGAAYGTAAGKTPRTQAVGKPPAPQPGFVSRSREAVPAPAAGPAQRNSVGKPAIPYRSRSVTSRAESSPRSPAPRARGPRGGRPAAPRPAADAPFQWLRSLRGPSFPSLGALMPLLPFILAVLVSGGALFAMRFLPFRAAASPAPVAQSGSEAPAASVPGGSAPSAPVAPAASPSGPATYVVREGDSLWRIFRAMGGSKGSSMGWVDFLSTMQEENSLADPDLIAPGNVLTLSAPQE
jgi:hypothetical protein